MLEKLVESLEKAPVVKKGDYDYFVHGLSDGVPALDPAVAMGIHLATALSLETGVPFVVIRKREYGLPGEHVITKSTGYGTSKLYINDLNEGDNIILIDDVVSTGGTLTSVINELKLIGVNLLDVIVAVAKGEGKQIVETNTGVELLTLVSLHVEEGKVVVDSVDV